MNKKPFIQNLSFKDVESGTHADFGPNNLLISITDPNGKAPEPKFKFKLTHLFEFLDASENDDVFDKFKISQIQSLRIVSLLQYALDNKMNVAVCCPQGIARSGAVVSVACMLGFDQTDRSYFPNLMVKYKLMDAAGIT